MQRYEKLSKKQKKTRIICCIRLSNVPLQTIHDIIFNIYCCSHMQGYGNNHVIEYRKKLVLLIHDKNYYE